MVRYFIISSIIIAICIVLVLIMKYLVLKPSVITAESFDSVSHLFYKNPQGIDKIGDPYIFKGNDGMYYLISTSGGHSFTGYKSSDMVSWERLPHLMYSREGNENYWGSDRFWAPCIVERNGRYYMYYSANYPKKNQLLISVAISDKPEGPYIDVDSKPVFDFGYPAIDPDVFIDDDGRIYMYFSRDMSGHVVDGRPESHIYVAELNDDMISVKGKPVKLLSPEQPFEIVTGNSRWNEGPAMIKHNNKYYLIYSGGFFGDRTYSLGYAVSDSPLGPFTKYEGNPVLQTYENVIQSAPPIVSGPGHNSIIKSPDSREIFICYHSHTVPAAGGGNRTVNLDRAGFRDDGTFFINGPTRGFQPKPSGIIEYRNVALEGTVKTSKGNASLLNDGEYAIATKYYDKYGFKCDVEAGKKLVINLKLNEKYTCKLLQFYVLSDGDNFDADIYIGNKYVIKDVKLNANRNIPGHSVIIPFKETLADRVKIVLKNNSDKSKKCSIGEIVLLGK